MCYKVYRPMNFTLPRYLGPITLNLAIAKFTKRLNFCVSQVTHLYQASATIDDGHRRRVDP